jgi:site-specific DNA recombinase
MSNRHRKDYLGLIGEGERLRGERDTLSIDRKQAIVKTVLDHEVIGTGTPGARTLDIDRVDSVWRL